MSSTDLIGLRVAVTGGTSGLGLALVRQLVARSASVAFVARTADAVTETAWNTGATGIVGDVSRKDDIHAIALQVTASGRSLWRCSPTPTARTSSVRSR
jgi:NAD(P)-dependent dehydrogenase (short-subunit alcohol dehydrogenase family)